MTTNAAPASHRPVHDKPTLLAFFSLATWSWFVYGFGASLALLSDEQGAAAWLAGLHAPALALGGVVGALATPRLTHRFGRGRMMRVAGIGTALAIVWFLLPGLPVGGTLAAIFTATLFGNIVVVTVNSFISVHQGEASPAAYTQNLALAALMGLIAPLAVGAAAATVLGWRVGLLVAVVSFALLEVWRGRRLSVFGTAGEAATHHGGGRLPAVTYWAVVAGMLYVGAEFCLSLWGVTFLREQTGLGAAAAAAGLGAYLGGLFVGRAFGSGLAARFSSETLMRLSIGSGIVAFMLAWMFTSPVAVLGLLFLTGLCLSLVWPLSLARIMRSAGGNVDRAAALTLAFTTAAIGLAPFALGAMVGSVSVRTAFLLVPLMLLVSLLLVVARPVREQP